MGKTCVVPFGFVVNATILESSVNVSPEMVPNVVPLSNTYIGAYCAPFDEEEATIWAMFQTFTFWPPSAAVHKSKPGLSKAIRSMRLVSAENRAIRGT